MNLFNIKRIKNIIFIFPPFNYTNLLDEFIPPPLGLGYIGTILLKNNFRVHIIDAYIENLDTKKIIKKIKKYDPDLIGLSLGTEARYKAAEIIKSLRKIFPNIVIIAGGSHVTLSPHDTLNRIPELDIIVRGEGEVTILELINSIQTGGRLESVKGISYRIGDKIYHNPPREPINDLDVLPFPERKLFHLDKYPSIKKVKGKGRVRFAHIIVGRGCPFSCIFCASSTLWGKKIRFRSIPNIIKEIKLLVDHYGYRGIFIYDDIFFTSIQRIKDFCNSLTNANLDISWTCFSRADILNNKLLLQLMYNSGCFSLIVGAESGCDFILTKLNKQITVKQIENFVKNCDKVGIITYRTFMISNPGETYKDALSTLEFMKKLKKYKGKNELSILRIYPGTILEYLAKKKGILPSDFSWFSRKKRGVLTLPSVVGDAPIFLDKMSWFEIADILFRWAIEEQYPVRKKVLKALKDIRGFDDMIIILTAAVKYFQIFTLHKIKNFSSIILGGVNFLFARKKICKKINEK